MVTDNGATIASFVVSADGLWSFAPSTDLAVGTHRLMAFANSMNGPTDGLCRRSR